MNYYLKLYKPAGYLSQFVNHQNKRRNKGLLGDLDEFPEDAFAVGRLDENSEGLLLITNDGVWSDQVNRTAKVSKEYYAQVEGVPTEEKVEQLRNGVELSHAKKVYTTQPCKVEFIKVTPNFPDPQKKIRDKRHGETSWLKISISEGKFRQVRKMTACIGHPCLRLIRTRIGNEYLGNLQPGESQLISKNLIFEKVDEQL